MFVGKSAVAPSEFSNLLAKFFPFFGNFGFFFLMRLSIIIIKHERGKNVRQTVFL